MGGLSHCALFGKGPEICRFSAAGMMVYRHAKTAGGRKAPTHEIAGVAAGAAPPALWDFVASSEWGVVNSVGRAMYFGWSVAGGG
jgi:hypothetical protein